MGERDLQMTRLLRVCITERIRHTDMLGMYLVRLSWVQRGFVGFV